MKILHSASRGAEEALAFQHLSPAAMNCVTFINTIQSCSCETETFTSNTSQLPDVISLNTRGSMFLNLRWAGFGTVVCNIVCTSSFFHIQFQGCQVKWEFRIETEVTLVKSMDLDTTMPGFTSLLFRSITWPLSLSYPLRKMGGCAPSQDSCEDSAS